MKTLNSEYQELMQTFGGHNISVIFNGINGYKDVRSYSSLSEVKKEIKNLLIE